jgi:hypothetical protein
MAHKYSAKRTEVDGIMFPSKAEAARYCQLMELVRRGEIKNLKFQPVFKFACGVKYVADFSYESKGQKIIEDVKGQETSVFKLKRRMLKHEFGVDVVTVKMDSRNADTWISAYKGKSRMKGQTHAA